MPAETAGGSVWDFRAEHDHLICIDSDGCAFDTMELKHRECFGPSFIEHWNLQKISDLAGEVWAVVNLYSNSRGCNRYQAVLQALKLLDHRPEAISRGFRMPDIAPLETWVRTAGVLSDAALKAAFENSFHPVLKQAYEWSLAANRSVRKTVRDVRPFLGLKPVLETGGHHVDFAVVSATSLEALEREWKEHNLAEYVKVIAGQEQGTKTEHMEAAIAGRYERSKVLKIGDAPGDLRAAREVGVMFYPIIPGEEEQSWKRFLDEAMERFLKGRYSGDYESALVSDFLEKLPRLS